MKVGSVAQNADVQQRPLTTAADAATRDRQAAQSGSASSTDKSKAPQEEILSQVKALLDGSYSIRFGRDEATMHVVIRLVDANSGDVIRQIPPEEFLQMAQMLDKQKGQLMRTTG